MAEHLRWTRGKIDASCINPVDVNSRPCGRYKGECKGQTTYRPEAVAQARFVARHGHGATGDEHWELEGIGGDGNAVGRLGWIDYMSYDASDASSDIELVELKHGYRGSGAENAATRQVGGYVSQFPGRGTHQVTPMPWLVGYADAYEIAGICLPGQATREVREYHVSSTETGVVMFWEMSRVT